MRLRIFVPTLFRSKDQLESRGLYTKEVLVYQKMPVELSTFVEGQKREMFELYLLDEGFTGMSMSE